MGLIEFIKNIQDKKAKTKEAENELRRQAEEEVSDEVIKIKKEKIKAEILSQARGEKKPESKGMNLLKSLGDEFKQSNLGNSEQMEKLLGKHTKDGTIKTTTDGLNTNRLMEAIGSKKHANTDIIQGKTLNTNKDLVGILGGSGASNEKIMFMTGSKKKGEKK